MNVIDINTWDDFEFRLRNFRRDHGGRPFLFRGLEDHRYELTTTLERHGSMGMSFRQYYRLISIIRPQIESFTQKEWDVPEYPEYLKWLDRNDSIGLFNELPAYDYMVYLRHHGFPSPLLDWTASPYVAAYFAFRGFTEESRQGHREKKVAICVFDEKALDLRATLSGEPEIRRCGPYVRSHKRHFFQQSDYTLCVVRTTNTTANPDSGGDAWCHASHEDVFGSDDCPKDLLWKFCIPATEQRKVQKMLDSYNLNSFSLFGSAESLMETMALRELHFRNPPL